MLLPVRRLGIAALLFAAIAWLLPASATGADGWAARQATAPRAATIVKHPAHVTVGEKMRFTVAVKNGKDARAVQIEQYSEDYYGNAVWASVASRRVRGHGKSVLTVTAEEINAQRYRARVTYRRAKPVVSKPVRVVVWKWYSLAGFPSYYETNGVSDYDGQFAMNGTQYRGWFTYGTYGMWEARYTPGRNCKAFRGDLGVSDGSADGSSASIALLTEEQGVVYESSDLRPGMVDRIELQLQKPYRFTINARDTSPDGRYSYPAIGHAQFLCAQY